MPDPKIITETTTLAELREQHHATGFCTGLTEANAIEAAFVALRQASQYRDEMERP